MMILCNYSSPFIEFNNNIMTIIVIKIIIFDVNLPEDNIRELVRKRVRK